MPTTTRSMARHGHESTSSKCSRVSQEAAIRADLSEKLAQLEREREAVALRRLDAEIAAAEAQAQTRLASLSGKSSKASITSLSGVSQERTEVWIQTQNNIKSDVSVVEREKLLTRVEPGPSALQQRPQLRLLEYGGASTWQTPAAPTNTAVRSDSAASPPRQTLPTHPTLGTHLTNDYNKDNKVNKTDTSDIQLLAEAIADLGHRSHPRSRRVSDLKIPSFSGAAQEWLPFKRTFERTQGQYDSLENISRLLSALSGSALEAVATLAAATDDPGDIMIELERRFGRPETVVRQLVGEITAHPRPANNDVTALNTFACKLRNCLQTMKLLNQVEYLASPELTDAILAKLSPLQRARWVDFAEVQSCKLTFLSKLELLSNFVTREAEIHLRFGPTDATATGKPSTKLHFISEDNCDEDYEDELGCHAAAMTPKKGVGSVPPPPRACNFCSSEQHDITKCRKFLELSTDDRWRWIIEEKACKKCLKKGLHSYRLCRAKCEIKNCSRPHHELLHQERDPLTHVAAHADIDQDNVSNEPTKNDAIQEDVDVAHSSSAEDETSHHPARPLLKVIPVTVFGPIGSVDTYALLDDGSTATLIDQKVASAIGADGPSSPININCIGGLRKQANIKYVNIEIKGRCGEEKYPLRDVRAITDLGVSSQTVQQVDIQRFTYLTDIVQDLCYDHAVPMLIIGADNWHITLPRAVRMGSPAQPAAVITALGWVLYGFPSSKTKAFDFSNHNIFVNHLSDTPNNVELESLIKDYHKLDSIGITRKPYLGPSDKRALEILDETSRRLENGRFETGLLWKPEIGNVPNNYKLALSRFLNLEKKLAGDAALKEAYKNNVEAMISKGYAEPCLKEPERSGITWYLPHFGVRHPVKQKLRVVHDAAAKFQGVSLNSMLLSGPDLLQPLLGVLMKFREGKIALNADIREMFPQVKIIERDRDAQRFLWRSDASTPVNEFRMSSMMFGATCSPCAAIYVKNKNAREHADSFPAAAEAIIYNHYMDDLLISLDTVEEAAQLAADVVEVHSRACFEMRSWVSNRKEALSLLPSSLCADNADQVGLSAPSLSSVRVLGMIWNATEDSLCFSRNLELSPFVTKRSILSQLMRVYDPLGLLTPIVIKGRLLFQDIWRLGTDWDTRLPQKNLEKWSSWIGELDQICKGHVPRCYLLRPDPIQRQLHLFSDASQQAYATVAYWRYSYPDGTVNLSLVGSKAKLAPIKTTSIPRLELQAALLASRYAGYIVEHHKNKPDKTVFWSDSLTVLKWLRSDKVSSFPSFVAHRVGEIVEETDVRSWRYVPTKLNVADDATRTNVKFGMASRWFSGPDFLLLNPESWPLEPSIKRSHEEADKGDLVCQGVVTTESSEPSSETHLLKPVVANHLRFSDWLRLVRATARVFVCARIFKACLATKYRNKSLGGSAFLLSAIDIGTAEQHLFRLAQLDSFSDEINHLRKHQKLPSDSRLAKLSILLDTKGILRLSSRVRVQFLLPAQEPDPIILDGRHRITELIILHYHKRFAHGNVETVVNELRQRFHIILLRPAVKRAIFRCQLCRIKKSKPCIPPFGNLPEGRLAYHMRPFTCTGLDYFGPVSVTSGRRLLKRWVALFTCLTTRALHLEIVENLTSDSAIMALRRFIARRGYPAMIYSDNGTAFVGASRQLSELFDFATNQRIRWVFIPPAAPFMGGCWERLVRSVKTSLKATLHERSPREEILHTLLLEAEAIINSRPLTHIPVDPESETPLTPNHFLLGGPSLEPPLRTMDEADLFRRSEWRKGLRLADHFWQRWTKEYLPTLIPRRSGAIHDYKVGDLVVVIDGTLPRASWPRGRITHVWPGSDGVVRVAEVATQGGSMKRATRLLAPVPVDK